MKSKFIKKMQDEKIEGEIIKSRAIDAILKEKEDEKKRREKAIQNQYDTKKGNDILIKMKEQQIEKEKEEERKIFEYA